MSFVDPRQEAVTFNGPHPGARIYFRVLRKPGRTLSSNFAKLLKESPRALSDSEAKMVADLIAKPQVDLTLSDSMRDWPEPVQINNAAIDRIGKQTVVTGFSPSFYEGCSQTAELNGPYNSRFVLADGDGKCGVIEEIMFGSQERDFPATEQVARRALSSLSWKKLNED